MKLPETRGKSNLKYDFEKIPIYGYFVFSGGIPKANSIRATARSRGYKFSIRTIDGEQRAYRVK